MADRYKRNDPTNSMRTDINTIHALHQEVSDPSGCREWQKTPISACFYRTYEISRIIGFLMTFVHSPCSLLSHAILSTLGHCITVRSVPDYFSSVL